MKHLKMKKTYKQEENLVKFEADTIKNVLLLLLLLLLLPLLVVVIISSVIVVIHVVDDSSYDFAKGKHHRCLQQKSFVGVFNPMLFLF